MAEVFDKAFVVLAILTGLAALGVLHCVACTVRNTTQVHDLRVKVNTLRNQQLARLKNAGSGDEDADYDIVPEMHVPHASSEKRAA
jgi:hypothetical protein